MKYVIIFTYMDGEELEISITPEAMDTFMDSLGKGEVYFDVVKGRGMWLPMDKIRCFHVEHLNADGVRVSVPGKVEVVDV